MAFPTVAARSSAASATSDSTTHAITMPTGITAGDLLLIVFSSDGIPTCTASAGWYKLGQASDTTNVVTQAIFFKWAAGGDTCTVTTSVAEQSSHVVLRVTGGGVPSAVFVGGNSTNSNPPAANLGYAQDWLWIATRSGDSTVVATAAPANYANLQSRAGGGTSGASTNTAERSLNATTEDPGTFTSATEQWVSATISIAANVALGARVTIDNFDDGTVNTAADGVGWEQWGTPPNSVESGGQLTITSTTGGTYHGMNQLAARTLDEAYLGSEMIAVGNQALTSLEVYPIACEQVGGNDLYYTFIGTNQVYTYTNLGGTALLRGVAQPYNAVIHRWFAIGESGGEIVWLHSPDGTRWRRQVAITDPTGGTFQPQGEIMLGTWQAEATTTSATWDNFSSWGLPALSASAAALSAASELTASGAADQPGAAILTAASGLAAGADRSVPAAAVLSAASSLTAGGVRGQAAAAAMSAASALSAAALRGTPGAAALSAASALTAGAVRQTTAAASLTAASALSGVGTEVGVAAAVFSASSGLTAAGVRVVSVAAALSAASALSAGGVRSTQAAAALSAASALLAGPGGTSAAAVLSAATSLSASGVRGTSAAASLSAASALLAAATGSAQGVAVLTAATGLSIDAVRTVPGAALLSAASALAASGTATHQATAALSAASTLVAAGDVPGAVGVLLSAASGLTASGQTNARGAAVLVAVSALLATVLTEHSPGGTAGTHRLARGDVTVRTTGGVVLLRRPAGTGEVVLR